MKSFIRNCKIGLKNILNEDLNKNKLQMFFLPYKYTTRLGIQYHKQI